MYGRHRSPIALLLVAYKSNASAIRKVHIGRDFGAIFQSSRKYYLVDNKINQINK